MGFFSNPPSAPASSVGVTHLVEGRVREHVIVADGDAGGDDRGGRGDGGDGGRRPV